MPNYTTSPNMSLLVPTVGVDPGPDWATNLNASLTILDQHNHSPGQGVLINPDGLNINADLPFNNNNATLLRSARFQVQSAPLALASDIGCLYVSGVDLYYNDVNGNQIKMTSGGTVNATSSGISSGTATASFVAGELVVNSAPNTPANIQGASILIGNNVANSNYVTLSAPNALAADETITLPVVPASTQLLSMTSSGNIAANTQIDNVTIINTSGILSVSGSSIPGTMFTHDFELNGNYGFLTIPTNQLDGLRFFNFNATIINAWAWIRGAGASGTTTVDIKYASAPGGSFASIFSVNPAFTSSAAAGSYVDSAGVVSPPTGCTAGVLSTTSVAAGGALRFDLIGTMVNPDSVGVTIVYKPR